MVSFFLSLGGNMGDRLDYLRRACEEIGQVSGVRILAVSSIYETEPVGYTDQSSFLNTVVQGETLLTARALLYQMMQIEKKLGRKREIRWGPRTIDIDILTYGTDMIREEDIVIPHPRMRDRAFVLVPMAEIAGGYNIPVGNGIYTTPLELLAKGKDKSGVKRWMDSDWVTAYGRLEN